MADESSRDRIDLLNERLDYLESILREQAGRLYAIEQNLGIARSAQSKRAEAKVVTPAARKPTVDESGPHTGGPQTGEPLPAGAAPSPAERSPVLTAPARRVPNAPAATGPVAGSSSESARSGSKQGAAARPAHRQSDLETRIGGSLFNWIGVLAISFGVAFFLKYAFENEWINATGRVLIGVAVGLGFLIGAERLRARGYARYAYGLSGGGILILYLSVFAAFARYNLIPHLAAFSLMAMITMTAALLAARYNALPIAILGLIGGFLTPVLLSTGRDNQVGLFGYIALLDAGVLALAYSKKWRSLNYLAFTATVLMFAAWMAVWYRDEKLWTTLFFLTLFFIIFALVAVLYNVVNRRLTGWLDLILVFINALVYFAASYELLEDRYHTMLGMFAILIASFYLALGYFTYSRDAEDRLLVLTFLGLAVLFAVLAVPIQLDQHWVTMGWALEGVLMTWIGLRVGDKTSRYAALVLFAIAVSHWFLVDVHDFAYRESHNFLPLLNRRALSSAVLIGSLVMAARLYKQLRANVEDEERSQLIGALTLGANVMAVTLLTLDANDYFEQKKTLARARDGGESPGGWEESFRLDNSKHFTITALWTLYGAGALAIGIREKLRPLRWVAAALLAIAALKLLSIDLSYHSSPWHTIIFNQTFAGFMLLVIALAMVARLYLRAEGIESQERAIAIPLLVVAANFLTIIALSAEANGHFARQMNAPVEATADLRDTELARQLALSMIWTVYGGVLLAIGFLRHNQVLRVMALLLLGLTILKVFLVDLASLDRFYRIISFIVLGAILLVVSFLYQRHRRRASELMDEAPTGLD